MYHQYHETINQAERQNLRRIFVESVMWMRIGPGDAPRRLGFNCGGALVVSEAEKVRIFKEVSWSQNTLGIQAMVTILILREWDHGNRRKFPRKITKRGCEYRAAMNYFWQVIVINFCFLSVGFTGCWKGKIRIIIEKPQCV